MGYIFNDYLCLKLRFELQKYKAIQFTLKNNTRCKPNTFNSVVQKMFSNEQKVQVCDATEAEYLFFSSFKKSFLTLNYLLLWMLKF